MTIAGSTEHEDKFYCDVCKGWFPKGEFREHYHNDRRW
jgi:hypothetical protein